MTAPRHGKFGVIQALRAVAANMVVVSHIIGLHSRLDPDLLPYNGMAGNLGTAGVWCFFFISGFVVVGSAGKSSWPSFVRSRFLRVFPIYWIYLAASVAFLVLWKAEDVGLYRIAVAASLLPIEHEPIVPVAWSLVYEVYFYAVVASMIAAGVSLRTGLIIWGGAVIALSPVAAFLGSPMALIFIIGGLASFARGRWVDHLLRAPVPRWLCRIGDASYSLYLCHMLVAAALSRALSLLLPGHWWVSAVACLILCNVVALLSFKYLEAPLMRGGVPIPQPAMPSFR